MLLLTDDKHRLDAHHVGGVASEGVDCFPVLHIRSIAAPKGRRGTPCLALVNEDQLVIRTWPHQDSESTLDSGPDSQVQCMTKVQIQLFVWAFHLHVLQRTLAPTDDLLTQRHKSFVRLRDRALLTTKPTLGGQKCHIFVLLYAYDKLKNLKRIRQG